MGATTPGQLAGRTDVQVTGELGQLTELLGRLDAPDADFAVITPWPGGTVGDGRQRQPADRADCGPVGSPCRAYGKPRQPRTPGQLIPGFVGLR